jgi:hypothetical protein
MHLVLGEIESDTPEAIAKAVKDMVHSLDLKPEYVIDLTVYKATVNIGINNCV